MHKPVIKQMKTIRISVFSLVFALFFYTVSVAQNKKIDSLKIELKNHKANDTTKVNLLNTLSIAYSRTDINKADEKLQEAYNLAIQLKYKKGEAKSLSLLSRSELKKGKIDDAEAHALKALKLSEEINDWPGIKSAYMRLAQIAHYNGNVDEATKYYNIILKENIKNGDSISQADMLNNLGISSYRKGDFDKALDFYKQASNIYEHLGKEHQGGLGTLNNIAIICLNQGRYSEALKYFNKCLDIYKKINDKDGIAKAYYNMSAVYYELKKYDKTLSYIDQALEIFKALEDKRMIAGTLINKGAVYADLKEFPKALQYMTESLRILETINDPSELAAANNQLGDLYFLMQKPEKALKHFKTCLELSLSIEDQIFSCHGYLGLAKTYEMLKDYDKALTNALKGKEIADNLELLAQQKLVSETLSKIYKNTGDYKKAFESHQQYKILSDSIFNTESLQKITQTEYEYKYKQQLDSLSINELRLTKTVQATSQDLQKSKRNYLWAIIGVLLLSIILGALIFNQRLKNEKNKTQNVVMEQKLLRSQMTPHFIFNSLSVLQGMILNKEEKKSIHYLSKFSKLLRITLENSRDKVVLLSQELLAIQNYLTLQNLESDTFNCTILVDDTIDATLFEIPPMLIQPFVENAIEHAFKEQTDNKRIDIKLTYNNKKLVCTIADNGVGIDSATKSENKNKSSLATVITAERLAVLSKDYNMEGSVTIEDRKIYKEQGTLVTLVIPHKIIASS